MEGRARCRQFSFNIVDFILCILVIGFVIVSFWDLGGRLHYFPVIFGLGALENLFIGIRIWLINRKVIGTIFMIAGVGLLVLSVVLSISIWG